MALELEARVDDGANGGVACTKHLVQPPSSEGFVRRAGRRGEQLKHHKNSSADRCPAELDTMKSSEVQGTGETAVRERGGDHQRTSLAQKKTQGSARHRRSTPRSPCASKTRDLARGTRLKGCRGAPFVSNFQMSRRKGAWRRSLHAHMRGRRRTHTFEPPTEANTHVRTPGAIK